MNKIMIAVKNNLDALLFFGGWPGVTIALLVLALLGWGLWAVL